MSHKTKPAGIALLITLLVVSLLTILIVEFTYSTEVEAHLTRNALSSLQARYLARAGLALGEILLRLDATEKAKNARPNVDTLTDPWAQPFPPSPIGEGVGDAAFRIDDETARFNINSLALRPGVSPVMLEARKTLFQGVLAAVGLDINLLFPLLDWLDPDDEVSGQSGAEREYYENLNPPYEPRNGRMLNLDELQLVRGFGELTREQSAALRAVATVLPNEELQINVNTASEPLLTAVLGAVDNPAAAKAIVAQRQDRPFQSGQELNEIPGWNQLPPQIRSFFVMRSVYFTIHAAGIAAEVTHGLAVLERRTGQRLDVLDWREEPGRLSLTTSPPSDAMNPFPSMNR
ncbi:MAG TPA: type II secretion system minor pseudopilin GspK [Candidatus Binatia bacterium]|nr:type II secretion system minor pseudopilin GspK [Candidatus Binatia bacterium]